MDRKTEILLNGVKILCNPNIKEETVQKAIKYQPFEGWLEKIINEKRFIIQNIELRGVDMFGPKNVGFIHLKANIVDKEGTTLPGIVFMRGGSVGISVILVCEGKKYTILTSQPLHLVQ